MLLGDMATAYVGLGSPEEAVRLAKRADETSSDKR